MSGGKSDNSISIATQRQLQQLNSLIQTTFHPRHHETIIEETEEEEETKSSSPKNPIKNEDFILVDLYEIRKEDANPENVVEMSSRPVSRLGQPVTSRETNTPKLKSMIVVPTELVMTGAPISAAHRLQNRRAINMQRSPSRNYDEERRSAMSASHYIDDGRRSSSRLNDARRFSPALHLNPLASQSAHINESFVHSSDDDDDDDDGDVNDLNSVTSDDSDLARSPAADIIRATYTSPLFDVSNPTLSTNVASAETSVEPCPVDGCPLNPKTRVSVRFQR